MKPRYLICTATAFAVLFSGCATNPHVIFKEAHLNGVTFSVSLPESRYVDDPIPIHLKIENGSSRDIAVDAWSRSASMILGAGTNDVPFTGPHSDILSKADPPQPRQILYPEHSYETDLNLEQYFHLEAGDYSLTVETVFWPSPPRTNSAELRAGPLPFTIKR